MTKETNSLIERLRIGQAYSDDFGEDMIRAANRIEALSAECEALQAVLASIKWKSADRDNMEFAATITYSQMDRIRTTLQQTNKESGNVE